MKALSLFVLVIIFQLFAGCSSFKQAGTPFNNRTKNNITVREDFQRYFDNCVVEGTIIVFDPRNNAWTVSDTIGEETTLISQKGLSDQTYEQASKLFDANYIALIIMAAITINSWNRIAISSNNVVR